MPKYYAFSGKYVHIQHRFETNVFGEAVKESNYDCGGQCPSPILWCERWFLDSKSDPVILSASRDPAGVATFWRPATRATPRPCQPWIPSTDDSAYLFFCNERRPKARVRRNICQPATGRRLSLPCHPSELAQAHESIMVLHCIYIYFVWLRNKYSAGVGPNQLFQPSDAYFAVQDSHPLLRTPAAQAALPLITSRVHTIFSLYVNISSFNPFTFIMIKICLYVHITIF